MKRILGIDYGEKRIGLALSDLLGFTAQGIETLENKDKKYVIDYLKKICLDNQVGEIVIGLPINMNGTYGPKANEVLQPVPVLESEIGVPVKTWDERLTSREVGRLMTEGGLSSGKQKKNVDRMAATVILQSYLESKRR